VFLKEVDSMQGVHPYIRLTERRSSKVDKIFKIDCVCISSPNVMPFKALETRQSCIAYRKKDFRT